VWRIDRDLKKANSYMKNKHLFRKSGGIIDYRHEMVGYAIKHDISSAARIL
jgi:hypothetical protein